MLAMLRKATRGLLLPEPATLYLLLAGVLAVGVASWPALKKHPLTFENRIQALFIGAALAYFLVMDSLLLT